jgi:hypothetical protein
MRLAIFGGVALAVGLVGVEQLIELESTPLDDGLDQPCRHEHRRDESGADRGHEELEQVVHDEEHRHDYRDGKQQHPADREEI